MPKPPTYAPGAPVIGATMTFLAKPLDYFVDGYRAHGSVYRTMFAGTTSTVLAGVDANKAVLDNPTKWSVGEPLRVFREQFSDRYLTQLDGEAHKEKRRRMTPGFRMRALVGEAETMVEGATEVLHHAAQEPTADLRELCARLVASTQTRAMLGIDFPQAIHDEVIKLEHQLLMGGALGPLRHLFYANPAYRRRKARLRAKLDAIATERAMGCPVDHGSGATDDDEDAGVVTRMIVCDESISPRERAEDLLMMLLAGSETTTNVLLWTLLLLQSQPEWCAQLDTELAGWSAASFGKPEDWPRLQATVVETERFRPPIPLLSKRAEEDVDVCGTTIPEGTVVLTAISVPHFLDEVYPDAQTYNPARFASGELPPPAKLTTFGGGPHLCLGMNLARLQEMLLVSLIRTQWDIAIDGPVDLTPKFRSVVTPAARSIPARVTARP
jgi:cytochrome P450